MEMLTNPFLKAMSICEGTVSILDAGCVVYSRIWCIFELFKSVMGDNSDYEFDVYTEIDGNIGRAIGITHGYIPSDSRKGDTHKSIDKKDRESKFPLDRILQAMNVNVKYAEASVESDRRFILNTITGRSKDEKVVDNHANYDDLNNILRGIFVTPVLERILKEEDLNSITRCLDILKVSNARIIDLSFKECPRFNDDILIKVIDSLPQTLTELRISNLEESSVTINGINAYVGKILGCQRLVKLFLSSNNIDDDGAKNIADALKVNHSLKELFLRFNNICDDGAKQIAGALEVNHSLKTLNMSFNNIDDDGAKLIADALKVNHSLKSLTLRNNKIGDDGEKYLTKIKQELIDANRNIEILWY